MSSRLLIASILLISSTTTYARDYRMAPSSTQDPSADQTTELYLTAANPGIIAEINGVRLSASPRRDFFKLPWIGINYIADVRRDMTEDMVVNASAVKLYINGQEVRRFTQAEQFAFLDKRKRSVDFWGSVSSSLAAMNASRTAGKYDYNGSAKSTVTDQYGNRAVVESNYRGTLVDSDEAQRAGAKAAVDRYAPTYDRVQAIEGYMQQVAEQSPEQRVARPGTETEMAYWVFDLPKAKRGVNQARLEVDINGRHFVFMFDFIR